MNKTNHKRDSVREPLSDFEAFTGGKLTQVPHSKTADFVIFYNLAVSNMEKMLRHYEGKELKLSAFGKDQPPPLKDHTYEALANYLWHAYKYEARNKDDHKIKDSDKLLIGKLLTKLEEIRNYHSHIWHDNNTLAFEAPLKKFVMEKYGRAAASTYETSPPREDSKPDKRKREFPLFKPNNGKQYITDEGRVFFLSFFLTTGQMSQLLQQRSGSKRTDEPLFKKKHIIYKYYCRRDGASILGFNHDESLLADMEPEKRKNIMMARQAYKLITYLHDYPDYLADTDTIGLMYPAPETKEKIKQVNTVHELLAYINERGLLREFTFSVIKFEKYDEEKDSKDEFEKNRSVAITHPSLPGFTFHIGFAALYQLVMLCLKYDTGEYAFRLRASMQLQAAHRQRLYEILERNKYHIAAANDEDKKYLDDRSHHYLRGYKMITERGIKFFEVYLKKPEKITFKTIDTLAVRIRPEDSDKDEIAPEPIIIFANDFIEKTEQKFRAGNRFVYYAAKYLADNNIVPDWYWEVEQFTPEKVKVFQKQISDGWRLSIENEHITVAIPKSGFNGNEIVRATKDAPQPMYQFSIGPRAMRYLLAFHFMNEGSSAKLNDFLAVALKNDFDKLTTDGWNESEAYELLEAHFMPAYLKVQKEANAGELMGKIKKRIAHITGEWGSALANRQFMKRAEKNRVVMQCYRLYDWTVSDKTVKFLRKDEYNNMSVCHYSMSDKNKLTELYEGLFKLDKHQPPIPRVVERHLFNARNLDDLMENVIADRRAYLQDQLRTLEGMPNNPAKKKEVNKLCDILGIPVSAKDGDTEKQHKKTLDVLPFAIQPVMVTKYYGHASYKDGYSTDKGTSRKDNDIFARIRKGVFSKGLYKAHYDLALLDKLEMPSADEAVTAAFAKQKHKWTGIINTTHTEDALLWQLSQKYLAANDYTKIMAEKLGRAGDEGLHVGNLYGSEIAIELLGRDREGNPTGDPVYVKIRMHQLDDAMFAQEQERLYNAAAHYIHRHKDGMEKAHWEWLPRHMKKEGTMQDSMPATENTYSWNETTGSKENPIPYHVLRHEMQLIAQHGKYLAASLLDWERAVIHAATEKMNNNAEKQAFIAGLLPKGQSGYQRFDFNGVLKLSGKNGTQIAKDLKEYRDIAFHGRIPVTATYSYFARPGSYIGKVLDITEPLHWRRDNSMYKNEESTTKK